MNKKLLIYLTLGFMFAAIAGTQIHEGGHYFAAKYFGYSPTLHYGSVSYGKFKKNDQYWDSFRNLQNDSNNLILEKEAKAKRYLNIIYRDQKPNASLIMSSGGPLVNMTIGTVGLILLAVYRVKKKAIFQFKDWLMVFLSLFWLRQAFNLLTGIGIYMFRGKPSTRGDEFHITKALGWPAYSIEIVTGAIAFFVLWYIVFRVVPKQYRKELMISGMFGGLLGFGLWFKILGPILLP